MSDHDLPRRAPANDIRHIKRYWIYVKAAHDGRDWANDLGFYITGHTPEDDDDESGGTRIGSISEGAERIQEFLEADHPTYERIGSQTQLDFAIQKKCFIVLRLYGNFWEFQNRSGGAIRTKDDHDDRYYRLLRHEIGGRGACVSFCADTPEDRRWNIRHGINLYVDFKQSRNGQLLHLPVVIDPDIENKGGNN